MAKEQSFRCIRDWCQNSEQQQKEKTEADMCFLNMHTWTDALRDISKPLQFLSLTPMAGKLDFHSLRYTFATKLARKGVSKRLAQELMRHSDPKLTANIYTDANPSSSESEFVKN